MADSVIHIPTPNLGYMVAGTLDEPKWAGINAANMLQLSGIDGLPARAGDTVDIPVFDRPSDFARVDITSDSDLTATALATSDGKAVVLRDAQLDKFRAHDEIRSGENFNQLWNMNRGQKAAKRFLEVLQKVLSGSIDAIDVPSANSHVFDGGTAAITVAMVRKTKRLMADHADELRTMIIHSDVWDDLLKDLFSTYQFDRV